MTLFTLPAIRASTPLSFLTIRKHACHRHVQKAAFPNLYVPVMFGSADRIKQNTQKAASTADCAGQLRH
jgi:hypothetical protein